MEIDRANELHQEGEGIIQNPKCLNCDNRVARDSWGWFHISYPYSQACVVDGKLNHQGLRADPGYEAYPDPRVEGCTCVLVKIDNMIGGIDWRPTCVIHGKDTAYYTDVFLPKLEETDRKLDELRALKKEKYARSNSEQETSK